MKHLHLYSLIGMSIAFSLPSYAHLETIYTPPAHPITPHPSGYVVDANGEKWFREGVRFHYEENQEGGTQKILQKCYTAKVHYGDPLDPNIGAGELPTLDCVFRKLSPNEDIEALKSRSFSDAESQAAPYLEAREQYNMEVFHEQHAGELSRRAACDTWAGVALQGTFGAWIHTISYGKFIPLRASTSWDTPNIVLQTHVKFSYEGQTHEEYWTDKNDHSIWVDGHGTLSAQFQATYYTNVRFQVCI